MTSAALRVAVSADGVSIWSAELFGGSEPERVRDFLARAFAVEEVEGVELRHKRGLGRIRWARAAQPAQLWRKLSRVFQAAGATAAETAQQERKVDATLVYLDGPRGAPVRVSRIGDVLSSWRVRERSGNRLRLSHPLLRRRRDVVFRLEQELSTIPGVRRFRASAVSAAVSITFDANVTTPERIARRLEKAWPQLLQGLDGPPSQKRLVAALGLLGLSYTGQFVVPALRPVAVAGVALYGLPNVLQASKQLTRGEVGLYAMYSAGLGFMLVSGMPFTASVMASFMQAWPQLTQRKLVRAQRRLFAAQRSRAGWARLEQPGGTLEVSVEQLQPSARVIVRSGELIPVDGVVVEGSGVLVHAAPLGRRFVEERSAGDAVAAGAFLRSGSLTVQVARAGTDTIASYVDSLLPRGALLGLPSSLEAERVAHRNAKPALALSLLTVALTRTPLPGQAALRPDYATGARLSAQLSALQGLAQGLQRGLLFKEVGALDRVARADTYVIDDSAGVAPQSISTASGEHSRSGARVARQVVEALHAFRPRARIVYLSQQPQREARGVAAALGVDTFHAGLSPQQKADILRGLGERTLWIGDGTLDENRAALAASSVGLSVAPLARAREDGAAVLLTQYGLSLVPEVLELADAHARRLARDYRTLYTLNLLGVAGAFLAGLSALQVGLLSNLGTGLIYARHARALDLLASLVERQGARLRRDAAE